MKVEQWQLAQLRPYEHNPRLNDEAVGSLDSVSRSSSMKTA